MRAGKLLYSLLRGTPLHPQWLSDRYHLSKLQLLGHLRDCLLLDIGSGNRNLGEHLDPSNRLLRLDYPQTSFRYANPPDIYGDAQSLPVATASVDVVVLFEVLEHVPDHVRALTEIARVLRPGGRLFLSVPFLYPIHDAPHDYFRFTSFGLRKLLEDGGFQLKSEMRLGNGFVVGLQLINLALLESVRRVFLSHRLLGLLAGMVAYPLCLVNNGLAAPLLLARSAGSACFGFVAIAERA